jgi:hypothetical protein
MAEMTEQRTLAPERSAVGERGIDARYQAFRLLHLAYIVAPTLAGLDKFFNVMTRWTDYLPPPIAKQLPFSAGVFMMIVGVVEIAAGLLVALKPRIGGYIVAAWLAGIIFNLVILSVSTGRPYYDIALRDLGLMLGALALARLATAYETPRERVAQPTRTTGTP